MPPPPPPPPPSRAAIGNAPGFVTALNCNDVLCGRGSRSNEHIGNVSFRRLVLSRKAEYVSTNARQAKNRIAWEIVDHVRYKADPPGRFLHRVEPRAARKAGFPRGAVVWTDAGADVALEKAKQALRQNRDRRGGSEQVPRHASGVDSEVGAGGGDPPPAPSLEGKSRLRDDDAAGSSSSGAAAPGPGGPPRSTGPPPGGAAAAPPDPPPSLKRKSCDDAAAPAGSVSTPLPIGPPPKKRVATASDDDGGGGGGGGGGDSAEASPIGRASPSAAAAADDGGGDSAEVRPIGRAGPPADGVGTGKGGGNGGGDSVEVRPIGGRAVVVGGLPSADGNIARRRAEEGRPVPVPAPPMVPRPSEGDVPHPLDGACVSAGVVGRVVSFASRLLVRPRAEAREAAAGAVPAAPAAGGSVPPTGGPGAAGPSPAGAGPTGPGSGPPGGGGPRPAFGAAVAGAGPTADGPRPAGGAARGGPASASSPPRVTSGIDAPCDWDWSADPQSVSVDDLDGDFRRMHTERAELRRRRGLLAREEREGPGEGRYGQPWRRRDGSGDPAVAAAGSGRGGRIPDLVYALGRGPIVVDGVGPVGPRPIGAGLGLHRLPVPGLTLLADADSIESTDITLSSSMAGRSSDMSSSLSQSEPALSMELRSLRYYLYDHYQAHIDGMIGAPAPGDDQTAH